MPRATTAACEVMPPRVVRMPSGGVHAVNVFGAGLDADENDLLALALERFRLVGGKHDFAGRCAGGGGKAGRDDFPFGFRVDRRMQQLLKRSGGRSA